MRRFHPSVHSGQQGPGLPVDLKNGFVGGLEGLRTGYWNDSADSSFDRRQIFKMKGKQASRGVCRDFGVKASGS